MFCMKQFSSTGLNLEISDMVKGIWVIPNSFHIKKWTQWEDIINNYFSSRKKFVLWPYHMSSENIHQVLMMERTGMCRSSIKQVLFETCSQDNQGKLSIYSRNQSLGLIPKHGLRASSVAEMPCKNYKLIIMARQKAHKENKLLEPT